MQRVLQVLRYPAQNPPHHQTRKHPIKPTHPETLNRDEYVSRIQSQKPHLSKTLTKAPTSTLSPQHPTPPKQISKRPYSPLPKRHLDPIAFSSS